MADLSTEDLNMGMSQTLHTHCCLEVLSFNLFSQSFCSSREGAMWYLVCYALFGVLSAGHSEACNCLDLSAHGQIPSHLALSF